MAGVPPSSADFAPSWLKFNSSNQCSGFLSKDNSKDNAYKRALTNSKKSQCFSFKSETASFKKYDSVLSHYDKSWPQLVGLESPQKEKPPCSGTSKNGQKLSFSTVCAQKNSANKQLTRTDNFQSRKGPSIEVDFPILGNNRLLSDQHSSMAIQPHNVWNKPLVLKSSDNNRSTSEKRCAGGKTTHDVSSIYKALVPKSSPIYVKHSYRRTNNVSAGTSNNHYQMKSNKASLHMNSKSPLLSRTQTVKAKDHVETLPCDGSDDTPSTPASKRHRKGKNVFLKELRHPENAPFSGNFIKECDEQILTNDCEEVFIGQEIKTDENLVLTETSGEDDTIMLEEGNSKEGEEQKDWWEEVNTDVCGGSSPEQPAADENPPLSSSLEAEHRLLREMGWTEYGEGADGDTVGSDEAPLTDAEIREFLLHYKKKGLLNVPSPSHRESAFRDALSAWLLSGPVMRRDMHCKGSKDITPAIPNVLSTCSSDSNFSDLSSDIDSD